jgi:hypothetical protein
MTGEETSLVKEDADNGGLGGVSLIRMIPLFLPPDVPLSVKNGLFDFQ